MAHTYQRSGIKVNAEEGAATGAATGTDNDVMTTPITANMAHFFRHNT